MIPLSPFFKYLIALYLYHAFPEIGNAIFFLEIISRIFLSVQENFRVGECDWGILWEMKRGCVWKRVFVCESKRERESLCKLKSVMRLCVRECVCVLLELFKTFHPLVVDSV